MSLRRVGILLAKEFLYGARSYMFVFSVVGPIVISVVVSLAFGTWLSNAPEMGIVDQGDSRMVTLFEELDAVTSTEYASVDALKSDVAAGRLDAGIVLPPGFDEDVIAGEDVAVPAYVWGESPAKNRTIISVAISDLVRELSGREAPVNIDSITLGGEAELSWSQRLLPMLVLMAMFLGGLMLPATSLATEKEKNTLVALAVTPVSLGDIFLAKGLLGFILSIFMGVLILILNQAFGHQPALLVLVLALGAVMAAELGMLLGAYINDFATLFTVWKTGGIILFAPIFVFLFPQIPQWVGNIFPTYYILQPIFEITQYGGGWVDIAVNTLVLVAIDVVLMGIILLILRRRQYTIAAA